MPTIKIEDKHIYKTYEASVSGNISRAEFTGLSTNFVAIEPQYPVQGTDENNRIGRKIHSQFLSEEGILTLNTFAATNSLLDYWNGYMADQGLSDITDYQFPAEMLKISIPIRHFYVDFYDEEMYKGTTQEKAAYVANWYKQLVIQTFSDPNINPSIGTDTKRESTSYTGKFKIYQDDTFYLGFESTHQVHFKFRLPLKRTINFDAEGSDPTNLHLFSVWIGPINPLTDYSNRAFGAWLIDTEQVVTAPVVAYVNSTMKLSYTDF